jgi:uncharacterized protein involved in type VI secretion and phage assembly
VPKMNMTDDDDRYGHHPAQRHYGKYAGTVSDNAKPQDGDHRGQIKVQIPGLLEETADGNSNQAMEVLALPAFHNGFFFVPEVGAQVWVEFVAGDINYPIWSGVFYPDGAPPKAIDASKPKAAGQAPTLDQKIIRTKSGQVVQLDDTSGSEQLVIKDEKNGNALTFSSSGIVIEDATNKNKLTFDSSGITIEDANNKNKIVFSSSGITVQAGGDSANTQIVMSSSQIQLKVANGVTVTIDSSKMDVE